MEEITHSNHLFTRKLFSKSSGNYTCPSQDTSGPEITPLFGDITFQHFAAILSGALGAVCLAISLFNVFKHATHYSIPTEQRQIIRVLLLIPFFSIISFLSILAGDNAKYFENALQVGESLALSAFLLLLCDYVIAGENGMDKLFNGISAKDGKTVNGVWLKRAWYLVLQFIPVSMILWIATAASEAAGTYCATSNNIHFAHIWITVINFLTTGVAITAILRFYGHMKPDLVAHNIFLKLFSFKSVVGIQWLQSFIIRLLVSSGTIKPTATLSYIDLSVTLPNLILSLEMPFFALLLLYSYRCSAYRAIGSTTRYQGGPLGLKAIAHALFVADLFGALIRGPMRLVRNQRGNAATDDTVSFVINKPLQQQTAYEGGHAAYGHLPQPHLQPQNGRQGQW